MPLTALLVTLIQAPPAVVLEPARVATSELRALASDAPLAVEALVLPPTTPVARPVAGSPQPVVATAKPSVFNLENDDAELGRGRYAIGKGFTVASKNGRYALQVRGRVQLRYDLDHPNAEGEASSQSLQLRRLRLALSGNVFSPHVKFKLQFGFSPNDMQGGLPDEAGIRHNPLRDARIELDRFRDFNVSFGQGKVPFSRQRVLSSSAQNLVDRSLVNAEFNLDRDLGVFVSSKDLGGLDHHLAYYAGVFMGEGRNSFALSDFGMLYVGRIEVQPFGKFADDHEGDLARSKRPGLAIAAAYAYQDRAHAIRGVTGNPPADGGTTDFHHATADILFKWHGVSLTTAFHVRRGFNRKTGGALDEMGAPIATVAARQGLGWFGQLGYVVPKIPLEVVGRYAMTRNIFGANSSLVNADEAGGGINYYFVGHDLKLQLDYFRVWDASLGTTPAEAARNGTDRLRLQVQVYF